MPITVNKNEIDFVEGENVASLLARMNYVFKQIVVKIDGQVIKKTDYETTIISDGAVIEAIHLIRGG